MADSTILTAEPARAPVSVAAGSSAGAKRLWVDAVTALAFLGDTFAVLAGLLVGYWVRFHSGWITFGVEGHDHVHAFMDYFQLFGVGVLFFHVTFFYLGFYSPRRLFIFRSAASVIVKGTIFWVFAYLTASLVLKFEPPISRIYAACSFICVCSLLLVWRAFLSALMHREFIARNLRQTLLFLGWSPEAARLISSIEHQSAPFHQLLGYIPTPSHDTRPDHPNAAYLGRYEHLPEILERLKPDMLVQADPDLDQQATVRIVTLCEKHFIQFKKIPSYFQIMTSGLRLEVLNGVPLMGVAELPLDKLSNRVLKRTVDIIGAVVGLCISAPIVAICGVLIYLESPGPIFYRQVRCGYKGELFKIIKLRSMKLDAEAHGGAQWAKKEDPRRLRIGGFLRKWNLDELPQFWNVLNGEMTLVGPRPERPELIGQFLEDIPHYNARHFSKPGLTGWAQVNGYRGDTSLTERVKHDLFYLENWTVWLDFQIMFQTLVKYDNAG